VGAQVELRRFGWRHAGRRAWALRGLDLSIERGERVLLAGPSGAGKSTLLAALAGLVEDESGEREGSITVNGRDPREAPDVGILFQEPETQIVMSRAGDDVAFGLENRGVPAAQIWPRVDEALAAVGFRYPRDRSTAALSGGEQQRLALAGALALRPALLLLDEPTANLDPAGARLVGEAIQRIAATRPDTTVVIVEHRVEQVLPVVDRAVVLGQSGGVLADGPPGEVFANHGAALAEQGVWVPGYPVTPRVAGAPAGDVLMRTDAVGFRHGGASTPALSDVDFDVNAGEVHAVVGPNGAGKSTLALMLGGLVAPTSGRVIASGRLASGLPSSPHQWRAADLARRIGSVFQDPEHQFLTGRVRDELALGPRRTGRTEAAARAIVDDLLTRLRLDSLALANPYTLSGGEQRRLSVATALATAPGLLILDEPTFGQDRRTWLELVDLLAKLRDDGCGIVTVTHDTDLVAALADRTSVL
jgi:energy-coupling factor transport system ATP-binding protein